MHTIKVLGLSLLVLLTAGSAYAKVERIKKDCIQDSETSYAQIDMPNGVRITGFGLCTYIAAPGMGRQGSSTPMWGPTTYGGPSFIPSGPVGVYNVW